MARIKIICHGGAWSIPDDSEEKSMQGVKNAAKAGLDSLLSGSVAEDAVVEAVVSMENDPAFNAGYGASLTRAGTVELDSMIMRGRDFEIGAVAAVRKVKNACKLARKVLHSDHTMIVGDGALEFAKEQDIEIVEESTLVTNYEKNQLRHLQEYAPAVKNIFGDQSGHDTVGAVAFDSLGNFAACTSTGGVTFKRVGRVGDSPLPGAGAWADDIAACSTTGHGEGITRALLAKRIVDEAGITSPSVACTKSLEFMLNRIGSRGGGICLTKDDFGFDFNTKRMPWCYMDEQTTAHGINPGEHYTK